MKLDDQINQAADECRKAFIEAGTKVGDWAWCCHHEIICEPLTEPFENRIEYILAEKPAREHLSRLQSFRPLRVELPDILNKAEAEYGKAEAECGKAWAECGKARAEYDKAWAEYDKAWAECDKAWAECGKARAEYDKAWAECGKARAECDKAWAEYGKAWAEYDKARAEYDKARDEHDKARDANLPSLNKLLLSDWPDTKWDGKKVEGT